MANIFKDLVTRIKIDYKEWRAYQRSIWDVRREKKLIQRAIIRAREKNFTNGKTYYIVRDRLGGINELNSDEFLFFTRKGLFTKEYYYNRFEHAIDIVTSNKRIRDQYYQIHQNQDNHE